MMPKVGGGSFFGVMTRWMVSSWLMLFSATSVLAEEKSPAPPVDLMGEVARVSGYLLLLIVLAVLAVRFGRKYSPQMGGGGLIHIEDGRNFAPGVGVRLIRVGSRFWLLGISKDHISLLAEMRSEDLVALKESPP